MTVFVKRDILMKSMRKGIVPERRFVTILFADIKGFTSLSESLDPEDVEDIINQIFSLFKRIIEDNGGYLDKFIGDAVMAVFGAPKSHSDDPRRAILSALKMQETIKKFNRKRGLDLGLRIGINTGEVLWSSIAGEKPTVMGDAVNVAQRMESIGEPGKVFVSFKTMQLADKYFEFLFRGETHVKGRNEPVKVYEVLREKEISKVINLKNLTPIFERDRELSLMRELYEKTVSQKKTTSVMVQGDSGIGKTRLLIEFVRDLQKDGENAHFIFVRSDPFRQGSYYVVSHILMEMLGGKNVEEISHQIEGLFRKLKNLSEVERKTFERLVLSIIHPSHKVEGSLSVSKERVNAIFVLFSGILSHANTPYVIVVDDFHHVDEESYNILIKFKDHIPNSPTLLLLSSRKPYDAVNIDHVITLSPLSKSSVYAFIRSIFKLKDEKISGEFADLIMEKTGGNPYYIEELLKYIKTKHLYEENPLNVKGENLTLPESLIGILTEKIDSMPGMLKEVVKTAACIGRVFWRGVLEIVMGKDVEPLLLMLEEKGIISKENKSMIENDTEYVFVHEILKDAAYSLLTRKERTKLHNIIGGILELYEHNAALLYDAAKHFLSAGVEEKARKLFEKAGDLSKREANFRFALKCYEGIKNPTPSVLLKKAEVLNILSEYERAVKVINKALQIMEKDDTNETYILGLIRLASVKEKQGEFKEVLNILSDIQNVRNPLYKAEILGNIAWAQFRMSDYLKSQENAEKALSIINRLNQTNPEVLTRKGMILNVLANVNIRMGEIEKAYSLFEEATGIYRTLKDRDRLSKVLINLSTYLMSKKEYKRALSLLEESLNLVTQTANRGLLPAIYNNMGLIYNYTENLDKSMENFKNALRISRNIGNKYMEMNVLVNISRLYITMQKFSKAEECLSHSLKLAREVKNRYTEGVALSYIAVVHYMMGRFHQAEMEVKEAFFLFKELKDTPSRMRLFPTYIDILISMGRVDEAQREMEKIEHNLIKIKDDEEVFAKIELRKSLILYLEKKFDECKEILRKIQPILLDDYSVLLLMLLKYNLRCEVSNELTVSERYCHGEPYQMIQKYVKGKVDKITLLSYLSSFPGFKIFSLLL